MTRWFKQSQTFLFALVLLATPLLSSAESRRCNNFLDDSSASFTANWLHSETKIAIDRIEKNISPLGAMPGVVIAATTPEYNYHWVRDAGLVMDAVVTRYEKSNDATEKSVLNQKLHEYLVFSTHLQNLQAKTEQEKSVYTGLGEPKYNVDGTIFSDGWARPQTDSPALRAISFIHWARVLMREGRSDLIRQKLYDSSGATVIKKDLEYVSHNWRIPTADLWEEVTGDHFYTRMVQRKALLEGAKLALDLGDHRAAEWYYNQGKEIEKTINSFWDPIRNYFVATRNIVRSNVPQKKSHLDAAVVLGVLHGHTDDNFMSFSDPRVLSTINKLIEAFTKEYGINKDASIPGIAIGRYTEDVYKGGNPWVLCTLAIAELYYKAAKEMKTNGQARTSAMLSEKADHFVERVRYHSHPSGSLNEQYDRNTGYMMSVEELTWNYAAILTTYWAQ